MRPRQITLDKTEQFLRIVWTDGHPSAYPLDGLRRTCPCAGCSGGHDNMGLLPDPEVFRQPARRRWDAVALEPVGTYALRFTWDDGHEAGIYTWKRLRAICPCAACSA